ncbi:MAG TPA: hypothetical protein VF957_00970 [Bradyrhizobium sp.]
METIAVRGILAALGVAASMLLAVAPSSAETPQQHDWCYGKGGATPEMKMAGCTAFIISGDHSDVEVAYAFHTRGGAHAQRGEWDSALSDFTTSVELRSDDRGRVL